MSMASPEQQTAGFDESRAGKRAECDGGTVFADGNVGREEFAGTLTGEYMEQGEPAWRWYRMTNLTQKPPDWVWDDVWCESGFLFVLE